MQQKNKSSPQKRTVAEYENDIDTYFRSCEGEQVLDENGEVVTDKNGIPCIIGEKPPTITGLALALGFASRERFLLFHGSKEMEKLFDRAKSRIEDYLESRLLNKDTRDGAKFCLTNNFKNWNEKKEPIVEEKPSSAGGIPLPEKQKLLLEFSAEMSEQGKMKNTTDSQQEVAQKTKVQGDACFNQEQKADDKQIQKNQKCKKESPLTEKQKRIEQFCGEFHRAEELQKSATEKILEQANRQNERVKDGL